jgi:hypothetical protein
VRDALKEKLLPRLKLGSYDRKWYPGIVTACYPNHTIIVRFMHAVGENRYRFPANDDIDEIDDRTILMKMTTVDFLGDARLTYRLHEADYSSICQRFNGL